MFVFGDDHKTQLGYDLMSEFLSENPDRTWRAFVPSHGEESNAKCTLPSAIILPQDLPKISPFKNLTQLTIRPLNDWNMIPRGIFGEQVLLDCFHQLS